MRSKGPEPGTPNQLGHTVHPRSACFPPLNGRRCPWQETLGSWMPTWGHTEDFSIICNVSIFCIEREKELKQLEQNASDCHVCAARAQLCALCSVYFSKKKSEAVRSCPSSLPRAGLQAHWWGWSGPCSARIGVGGGHCQPSGPCRRPSCRFTRLSAAHRARGTGADGAPGASLTPSSLSLIPAIVPGPRCLPAAPGQGCARPAMG